MYGVILLDSSQIIIFIYKYTHDKNFIVLNTNTYNLTTTDESIAVDATHILAVLMSFFLSHKSYIREWRVISKGLPEEVVKDVAKAIDIPYELLTSQREQELLCKAIATEIVRYYQM